MLWFGALCRPVPEGRRRWGVQKADSISNVEFSVVVISVVDIYTDVMSSFINLMRLDLLSSVLLGDF